MATTLAKIVPCLWYDTQAEQAAEFYCGVFPDSEITARSYYTEAGQQFHQKPPGSIMTVGFTLDGQPFTALNGGPQFQFTEALSLQVLCDTQEEIDHYWSRLGEGGAELECGWLKDRFGLSWQIVPSLLHNGLAEGDAEKTGRVMGAIFASPKPDLARLKEALE